jgi:hypothetical protein
MKYWFAATGVLGWLLGMLALVASYLSAAPLRDAQLPPDLVVALFDRRMMEVGVGLLLILIGQVSLVGFSCSRHPG